MAKKEKPKAYDLAKRLATICYSEVGWRDNNFSAEKIRKMTGGERVLKELSKIKLPYPSDLWLSEFKKYREIVLTCRRGTDKHLTAVFRLGYAGMALIDSLKESKPKVPHEAEKDKEDQPHGPDA